MKFGDERLPSRFWIKVQRSPDSECWEWTAYRTPDGYGVFGYEGSKTRTAHRHAYMTLVGEVPTGLELDHLCRNRACCNPAHLEPVTRRVNVLRGQNDAAKNAQKTHCDSGHELTAENVYVRGNRRACKVCRRQVDADRAQRPNRKEARRIAARNAYRIKHGIPVGEP